MSDDRQLADTMVRAWVRLYTVGLDRETRYDRRAEIDSDLWEQRNDAALEGATPAATTLSIFGRWVAGMAADLGWTISQRLGGQPAKESMMMTSLENYWKPLAVITAVATAFFGIRQFLTDEVSAGISAGKIMALVLFAGAGLLVLAGLLVHRTNPRLGAVMVIVGVLPVAAVGGFGLGLVIGVIASLAGGLGWWWLPVGIASAIATAAGVGAFGAWWNASPNAVRSSRRIVNLPIALMAVGLLVAGVGVGFGLLTSPLVAFGAVILVVGAGLLSRRLKAPLS